MLGAEVPLSWLVARRHGHDLRSHAAQTMDLGSPEPAG
jgi:hypothetical protein